MLSCLVLCGVGARRVVCSWFIARCLCPYVLSLLLSRVLFISLFVVCCVSFVGAWLSVVCCCFRGCRSMLLLLCVVVALCLCVVVWACLLCVVRVLLGLLVSDGCLVVLIIVVVCCVLCVVWLLCCVYVVVRCYMLLVVVTCRRLSLFVVCFCLLVIDVVCLC